MSLEQLYAYLSIDPSGTEVLVGVEVPGAGWLPLVYRSEAEALRADPLVQGLRDAGHQVWLVPYFRGEGV